MKEIGSFIELELPRGLEYRKEGKDLARLNTGRAAIWHAFRLLSCSAVWLPYYQCETVREFLLGKGCMVKYYHIDEDFNPVDLAPAGDEAVLLVNYFGVMSDSRMSSLAARYSNVIVDNCQAFFAKPVSAAYNVYSARKFVGVPDGAYVVGKGASKYVDEYPQGYSSDTADFLFKRIEYGCSGKAYQARSVNEQRIDTEDIMKMSPLTLRLLDGADYRRNIDIRQDNFFYACSLFSSVNLLDASRYADSGTVPMVYPLVVEDDSLLQRLLEAGHFQGHWWQYITKELPAETFEHWLSRYVVPITIDQRYGRQDLDCISKIIL